MDLNLTIALVVALNCVVTIVRILSSRLARINSSWLIVSVALLTVLGVAWVLTPDNAGYIAGSFWLVFYLIPVLGYRWMNRLFDQQNYIGAYKIASVLRWLHPVSGWSNWMEIIRALDLSLRGDLAQATELLSRNQTAPGWIGRAATGQLYRMTGNWQEMVTWLRGSDLRRDPTSLGNYIRALGETGNLNGMVAEFERQRDFLRQSRGTAPIAVFVLALCGQPEGVERLFNGPLRHYQESLKLFWLASANLAAGKNSEAEPVFQQLSITEHDPRTRNAVARRLAQGLPLAHNVLTPESQQALAQIEQTLEQEQRYDTQLSSRRGIPFATYALIAINVIVFIIEETNGGSTSNAAIYRLGALWPPAVAAGDWWRLITPLFLHFGITHIALNMLALFVLGPYVESALGILNYLIVYFVAGIGSSIFVYALVQAGMAPNDLYLGASGAIMGVLGAMAAIMYRGWRRDKAPVARNRLVGLLLIIALQVAIDASFILQSSLPAHLGGAVLGFVIALLMPHHRKKTTRQSGKIKPDQQAEQAQKVT